MEQTLKDIDGNYSSKRVAAFWALTVLTLLAAAAVFGRPVPEFMVSPFTYISISGIGLALAERWAPK